MFFIVVRRLIVLLLCLQSIVSGVTNVLVWPSGRCLLACLSIDGVRGRRNYHTLNDAR